MATNAAIEERTNVHRGLYLEFITARMIQELKIISTSTRKAMFLPTIYGKKVLLNTIKTTNGRENIPAIIIFLSIDSSVMEEV
ncbi:hypothetical protein COB52_03345 [Candidatus Kaiserbacteria bacterium]|nr:MAG: hypothetical protein COB52_03345 [Candidatus Kaiserbacteria bacterium]